MIWLMQLFSSVYSAGRAVPAPGIKLFLEYYKREYLQDIEESNTQSLRADITKDMRRIFDAMSEFSERAGQPEFAGAKPFMFVLPDVSRYMTSPGEPDDKESAQLMILFNAMQIVDTPCKLLLFESRGEPLAHCGARQQIDDDKKRGHTSRDRIFHTPHYSLSARGYALLPIFSSHFTV